MDNILIAIFKAFPKLAGRVDRLIFIADFERNGGWECLKK